MESQYVRFWIRSVILLVPATFVILYFGSHVPLVKVLIACAIEALFGIVTVIPLIVMFSRVDRTRWAEQDEYALRIIAKRAQIEERRRAKSETPDEKAQVEDD